MNEMKTCSNFHNPIAFTVQDCPMCCARSNTVLKIERLERDLQTQVDARLAVERRLSLLLMPVDLSEDLKSQLRAERQHSAELQGAMNVERNRGNNWKEIAETRGRRLKTIQRAFETSNECPHVPNIAPHFPNTTDPQPFSDTP